jgi:hypothetical protein
MCRSELCVFKTVIEPLDRRVAQCLAALRVRIFRFAAGNKAKAEKRGANYQ